MYRTSVNPYNTSDAISAQEIYIEPGALAVDAAGTVVYFIDSHGHVIDGYYSSYSALRKIVNASVVVTIVAAPPQSPTFGYAYAGVRAIMNTALGNPTGLAVGRDGRIYVSENFCNCVWVVDQSGEIRTLAGTGYFSYNGDGIPARAAQLLVPAGIAMMPNGSVAFAENGNNVLRFVDNDGILRNIAASSNTSAPLISALANNGPTAIACNSRGDVFVVVGCAIVVMNATTGDSTILTGNIGIGSCIELDVGLMVGSGISANYVVYDSINNIAVDSSDNLYLTIPQTPWEDDNNEGRYAPGYVLKLDVMRGEITRFAGTNTTVNANVTQLSSQASDRLLHFPAGISTDPTTGSVVFADTGAQPGLDSILLIDRSGVCVTVATGISGTGLAIDRGGNIYVVGKGSGDGFGVHVISSSNGAGACVYIHILITHAYMCIHVPPLKLFV